MHKLTELGSHFHERATEWNSTDATKLEPTAMTILVQSDISCVSSNFSFLELRNIWYSSHISYQ